jgi:hypothetical protein
MWSPIHSALALLVFIHQLSQDSEPVLDLSILRHSTPFESPLEHLSLGQGQCRTEFLQLRFGEKGFQSLYRQRTVMSRAALKDFVAIRAYELTSNNHNLVVLHPNETFLADHLAFFAAFWADRILHVQRSS